MYTEADFKSFKEKEMRTLTMRWGVALAVLVMAAGVTFDANAQEAAKVELKVGDKAPDFKLPGSDGKEYTLSQYKGKQAVVLAFFPKAFTGG